MDRALIWCEDHGSLAFYHSKANKSESSQVIESGDLVRFKLRETDDMRYAEALEVIATEEYPTLARQLQNVGHGCDAVRAPIPVVEPGSNIVPFDPRRVGRSRMPVANHGKVAAR